MSVAFQLNCGSTLKPISFHSLPWDRIWAVDVLPDVVRSRVRIASLPESNSIMTPAVAAILGVIISVTNVGAVFNTNAAPDPVEVVTPVPPRATAKTPDVIFAAVNAVNAVPTPTNDVEVRAPVEALYVNSSSVNAP